MHHKEIESSSSEEEEEEEEEDENQESFYQNDDVNIAVAESSEIVDHNHTIFEHQPSVDD